MRAERIASASLREAMAQVVPPTGAILTPQLTARIKSRTLDIMKRKGLDLTMHRHQIKLEFLAPDRPNLVIPPHLLNARLH